MNGQIPTFEDFDEDFRNDFYIGWNDEAVIEDYKNNYLKNNLSLSAKKAKIFESFSIFVFLLSFI